jgi:hypothetical protein
LQTSECGIGARELLAFLETPAQQPEMRAHLQTCPSCQEKLARLYRDLVETEESIPTDSVLRRSGYKPPDLSFLTRVRVPDKFGEIVRRGAYWVQSRARSCIIDLGALLQAPERQVAPALAIRSEEHPPANVLYQIALGPDNLDNLDVEVTVYRHPQKPEMAKVVIYVRVPGRLLAGFAGSRVQMKTRDETVVTHTLDDGRAVFEDVPLVDLREAAFEIVPA